MSALYACGPEIETSIRLAVDFSPLLKFQEEHFVILINAFEVSEIFLLPLIEQLRLSD